MKNFNNKIIDTAKILVLGLILAVGVSYVGAWVGPSENPPGGNLPAPINISAFDQLKDTGPCSSSQCGGLSVGTFLASKASQFTDRVTLDHPTNHSIDLYLGSNKLNPLSSELGPGTGGDIYLREYAVFGSSAIDPLCIERASGKITPCGAPPVGTPSVNLTVNQPTIATSEVVSISQSVDLSWTTQSLVGATCTSTQNNGSTGFTTTPSYAGGTDAATIEKFGTTTFTISCTPSGGGTAVTDSVTVVATGQRTFTSGTGFTPNSAEFNSGTSFTVRAVGGGGGGPTYGGVLGDYDGTNGGNGTQTTVTYNSSTFLSAAGGGGATFNPSSAGNVTDPDGNGPQTGLGPQNGTTGAGSSGSTPGYNLGAQSSNQNCGSATTILYGAGGAAGCNYNTAVSGGAGGAQSATSTWTSGAYSFLRGTGGTGPNATAGGQAQNGGSGAVRFIW